MVKFGPEFRKTTLDNSCIIWMHSGDQSMNCELISLDKNCVK